MPVWKRHDIETTEIITEEKSEFQSLVYSLNEQDNEKILGFCLTNMSLGTQEIPRYEMKIFESEIDNHASLRYETLDDSRAKIPQLDFSPVHVLIRDTTEVNPFASEGVLVDDESFEVNPIAQKIEFMDGSFLEHVPENVTLLLEEFNVPYLAKNFDIEVFEIVNENSDKKLVPIKEWDQYFEIGIDNLVPEVPMKTKQRNNFF